VLVSQRIPSPSSGTEKKHYKPSGGVYMFTMTKHSYHESLLVAHGW